MDYDKNIWWILERIRLANAMKTGEEIEFSIEELENGPSKDMQIAILEELEREGVLEIGDPIFSNVYHEHAYAVERKIALMERINWAVARLYFSKISIKVNQEELAKLCGKFEKMHLVQKNKNSLTIMIHNRMRLFYENGYFGVAGTNKRTEKKLNDGQIPRKLWDTAKSKGSLFLAKDDLKAIGRTESLTRSIKTHKPKLIETIQGLFVQNPPEADVLKKTLLQNAGDGLWLYKEV